MKVNYSGWKNGFGSFDVNVFVDEKKTDYTIHYKSGKVWKQATPFQTFTYDWNNDGDVYSDFGAFFDCYDKDGNFERKGLFMSPVNMVAELIEGINEPNRKYHDPVVSIPGIEIPEIKYRTLEERIVHSEKRALAQEVERNRKMASLGIRGPGESWVK